MYALKWPSDCINQNNMSWCDLLILQLCTTCGNLFNCSMWGCIRLYSSHNHLFLGSNRQKKKNRPAISLYFSKIYWKRIYQKFRGVFTNILYRICKKMLTIPKFFRKSSCIFWTTRTEPNNPITPISWIPVNSQFPLCQWL